MDNDIINEIIVSVLWLLIIIFIVLKIFNFITWSWILVLSPIWGFIVLMLILNIIFSIIEFIEDKKIHKN